MDEPGAVEQHVHPPGLLGGGDDVRRVGRVQPVGADAVAGDLAQLGLVEVGGDDMRALGGERQRGGAADPLGGGGDKGRLAGEAIGHPVVSWRLALLCAVFPILSDGDGASTPPGPGLEP